MPLIRTLTPATWTNVSWWQLVRRLDTGVVQSLDNTAPGSWSVTHGGRRIAQGLTLDAAKCQADVVGL